MSKIVICSGTIKAESQLFISMDGCIELVRTHLTRIQPAVVITWCTDHKYDTVGRCAHGKAKTIISTFTIDFVSDLRYGDVCCLLEYFIRRERDC